jgi:hypothetical protein
VGIDSAVAPDAAVRRALLGLFRETWKIVFVVATGVGIAGYAVQEVQRKLQEKNKAREQVVERDSVALQQQEQELNRAREIQTDLLPKMLPQLPGVELAGAWQPARSWGQLFRCDLSG